MTTIYKDTEVFSGLLSATTANFQGAVSVIGQATQFGFSITNLTDEKYTISATSSSAADANNGLATLISQLQKLGILVRA